MRKLCREVRHYFQKIMVFDMMLDNISYSLDNEYSILSRQLDMVELFYLSCPFASPSSPFASPFSVHVSLSVKTIVSFLTLPSTQPLIVVFS